MTIAGYIGLHDPDTMVSAFGISESSHDRIVADTMIDPIRDIVMSFALEARLAGDEAMVEYDRHGECLSQGSIIIATINY